ncbi:monovalent cation/H(+) antiporter subunit G [Aminobacter sp. AP02]|uniref:monovalent cation/H(+) antiporter subunit G n=1 Tax=Aminobacter sp. AP02 TaxID=2135737 RepID=UPI000D6A89AD|nr:monovalent cation/H(+) antiporter subunit G [Aminobacter sp. AP02]PWK75766.1 multicomponent Na+:H+ antiporter subunit G [Aminobacter sp. AP02]
MIDGVGNYVAGTLVVIGALFALTASIGLLRLPDIYTRMHAASKAGTVGSCLMLIGLAVHIGESATALRALAGVLFLLLTAPISAHLLAKAAYSAGYRMWGGSVSDDLGATVHSAKKNDPLVTDR